MHEGEHLGPLAIDGRSGIGTPLHDPVNHTGLRGKTGCHLLVHKPPPLALRNGQAHAFRLRRRHRENKLGAGKGWQWRVINNCHGCLAHRSTLTGGQQRADSQKQA